MEKKTIVYTGMRCTQRMASTEDALFVLGGKWTLRIMIAVIGDYRRFNELQRTIKGISARVLSAELKDLEMNGLVERVVLADQKPVIVEYIPTEYSQSLAGIITTLADWGYQHKKRLTNRKDEL